MPPKKDNKKEVIQYNIQIILSEDDGTGVLKNIV